MIPVAARRRTGSVGYGRRSLAAGVLACVAALPVAAARKAQDSPIVVSRETCKGLFLLSLEWTPDDRPARTLLAVFDTGGSNFFIDPDAIERVSGKRVEAGKRVRFEDVSVAGLSFRRFRPRVRELDHLSLALGRELDVFLPFHSFDDLLLTMDYPAGEMRLSRGSLPEPDGVEVFPARGRDRRPWLRVRIGSRTRSLLIDSGSNGTIVVDSEARLRWTSPPRPIRITQGMDGLERGEVGRLNGTVVVGSLRFEDPIMMLTRDTEHLGTDVLRHFVVSFDQANRRVRLRPAERGPVRLPARRGVGALGVPRRGYFEVMRVLEGSPAKRAGLRKGDRIVRIDGTPVDQRGCGETGSSPPGSVRYAIERKGTELEFVLEREVLIP